MRVIYDREANVLRIITDTPAATAASLLDDPGVAVELATDDGHDIVGLILMGASAYIPLGKSYDAASDTLLLGRQDHHLRHDYGERRLRWVLATV